MNQFPTTFLVKSIGSSNGSEMNMFPTVLFVEDSSMGENFSSDRVMNQSSTRKGY